MKNTAKKRGPKPKPQQIKKVCGTISLAPDQWSQLSKMPNQSYFVRELLYDAGVGKRPDAPNS